MSNSRSTIQSDIFPQRQQHSTMVPIMVNPTVNSISQAPTMPIPARSAFEFFSEYQRQLISTTRKKENDSSSASIAPCKAVDENDERDEDEDTDDDCFAPGAKLDTRSLPKKKPKAPPARNDNKQQRAFEKHKYGHEKLRAGGMSKQKELLEIIDKRWEQSCPATQAFFQLEAFKDLSRFKREMDTYHLILLNGSANSAPQQPPPPALVNESNFGKEPNQSALNNDNALAANNMSLQSGVGHDSNDNKRKIRSISGQVTPNNKNNSRRCYNYNGLKSADKMADEKQGNNQNDGVPDGSLYGHRRPFYEIARILNKKPSWYITKTGIADAALGSIH